MRFAILGPAVVDDGSGPVTVPRGMGEVLLVTLLIECGAPVSADALTAAVWADRPPATAAESLRNHLTRLRRTLGPEVAGRLRQHGRGYRIEMDGADLDVIEFCELVRRGRELLRSGAGAEASATLASALKLWRQSPCPALMSASIWGSGSSGCPRSTFRRWSTGSRLICSLAGTTS